MKSPGSMWRSGIYSPPFLKPELGAGDPNLNAACALPRATGEWSLFAKNQSILDQLGGPPHGSDDSQCMAPTCRRARKLTVGLAIAPFAEFIGP